MREGTTVSVTVVRSVVPVPTSFSRASEASAGTLGTLRPLIVKAS